MLLEGWDGNRMRHRIKLYSQTWVMIPAPLWDGVLLTLLVSGIIMVGLGVVWLN